MQIYAVESRSIGSSKHFLLFENYFRKITLVYSLIDKTEVFDLIKEFKAMVENQKARKIKRLRSDNGKEYFNKDIHSFLKCHGNIYQKINPHAPQQNEILAIMNKAVVEEAKCLVFNADLEIKFWGDAINKAVYLKNRSVAASLKRTTN